MAKHRNGLRFQPAGGERAASVPVGKKQRLHIERLAHDGRGIAFIEKKTWFVSGALAGEEVEARVLAARANIVEARAEKILSPSADRQTPACQHASICGGCTLQHMPYAQQVALKEQQLKLQLGKLDTAIDWAKPLTGPELAYRRRARVAVRWHAPTKHLAVGFRAEASQDIVDVQECLVLSPLLQPMLKALPQALRALSKPQHIGHVELFEGLEPLLLVRATGALSAEDLAHLQAFCQVYGASFWLQTDAQPQPVADAPLPRYRLAEPGLTVGVNPGDFVQVNAWVNQAMLEQALNWLAPKADERVLDLFCGAGNFALPLARLAKEVVAVEGVGGMVERGRANAAQNALENVCFHQADLTQPLKEAPWAQAGFDAVLLDPPRDGALEVTKHVAQLAAKRILYVSCNPATLARDAALLIEQGYQLARAGMLDMFPQTAHIEAMALFVKR